MCTQRAAAGVIECVRGMCVDGVMGRDDVVTIAGMSAYVPCCGCADEDRWGVGWVYIRWS